MATPQQYLVTPTTGIDQSMVELLSEVLEVDPLLDRDWETS